MKVYERKYLLTQEEYECLLGTSPACGQLTLQNDYYDTPDLAGDRQAVTYRIRTYDGRREATVKRHLSEGHLCEVTTEPAVNPLGRPSVFPAGLILWGRLTTQRIFLVREKDFRVSLDKSFLPDGTDYELEVACSPRYDLQAQMYVLACHHRLYLHCPGYTHTLARPADRPPSKSRRFFAAKGGGPCILF